MWGLNFCGLHSRGVRRGGGEYLVFVSINDGTVLTVEAMAEWSVRELLQRLADLDPAAAGSSHRYTFGGEELVAGSEQQLADIGIGPEVTLQRRLVTLDEHLSEGKQSRPTAQMRELHARRAQYGDVRTQVHCGPTSTTLTHNTREQEVYSLAVEALEKTKKVESERTGTPGTVHQCMERLRAETYGAGVDRSLEVRQVIALLESIQPQHASCLEALDVIDAARNIEKDRVLILGRSFTDALEKTKDLMQEAQMMRERIAKNGTIIAEARAHQLAVQQSSPGTRAHVLGVDALAQVHEALLTVIWFQQHRAPEVVENWILHALSAEKDLRERISAAMRIREKGLLPPSEMKERVMVMTDVLSELQHEMADARALQARLGPPPQGTAPEEGARR